VVEREWGNVFLSRCERLYGKKEAETKNCSKDQRGWFLVTKRNERGGAQKLQFWLARVKEKKQTGDGIKRGFQAGGKGRNSL